MGNTAKKKMIKIEKIKRLKPSEISKLPIFFFLAEDSHTEKVIQVNRGLVQPHPRTLT